MLKSVAQAIPNSIMRMFLLLKSICMSDGKKFVCIWRKERRRKNLLVTLVKAVWTKTGRRIRFQNFHNFNVAILAKQVLRLLQN